MNYLYPTSLVVLSGLALYLGEAWMTWIALALSFFSAAMTRGSVPDDEDPLPVRVVRNDNIATASVVPEDGESLADYLGIEH